jgi:hypothetical protein
MTEKKKETAEEAAARLQAVRLAQDPNYSAPKKKKAAK